MVNLTFYNKSPPSNKPPGGLIKIQEKVENKTVLKKHQGGKWKQQFIVKYDWNSYISQRMENNWWSFRYHIVGYIELQSGKCLFFQH